jgi:hypothetical protein
MRALTRGAGRHAGGAKFEPVRFWSAGFWALKRMFEKDAFRPIGTSVAASFVG